MLTDKVSLVPRWHTAHCRVYSIQHYEIHGEIFTIICIPTSGWYISHNTSQRGYDTHIFNGC
jgi:hypothetical protein